ncbi:heme-binding protein [Halobacteria archaeon AArc-m2/3/4]|uniref:Heme-binding protein n=1 Tax=Natronoglomus mannanivorans TaxID=2979990 RepID=A0AAP2YXF1_9EURY|nr:heme-binding protein [Halobacteria archaeon AArc-xg1-1]MCU4973571.1 heme-binding protein [Halobacteria archaeon AArc-m2/3/4]
MVRSSTIALGVAGSVVAAVSAWNLYQRRTTATVPYETVATVGDVELRRYPSTVLVRTDASSEREAFGRLFRYITGANVGDERISMTAPVEVDGRGPPVGTSVPAEPTTRGERIPMTAPVEIETGRTESAVRMAFYLPAAYDIDSAPEPTEADLELVSVPKRTLAVRRFSWRPTDDRVARESERLLEALERAAVPVGGEPFFLGYDAPWTLPFLRRNEVAVEVEAESYRDR